MLRLGIDIDTVDFQLAQGPRFAARNSGSLSFRPFGQHGQGRRRLVQKFEFDLLAKTATVASFPAGIGAETTAMNSHGR